VRRALTWDAIGVLLVSLYGTEVCPVLERMGAVAISWVVVVVFLAGELVFTLMGSRLSRSARGAEETGRVYALVLARHAAVGLTLAAWDANVLHIAWVVALKVAVGTLTFGHFVGVDLALARERETLAGSGEEAPSTTSVPEARSLVRRLTTFAIASVLLVVAVVTFMIVRDVDVLASAPAQQSAIIRDAVAVELAVAGVVVTLLTINLITSFARNATLLFANQTRVLAAVGRGELESNVPVVTDDEFGVIAAHTNRMIEGLRERRKIRDTLGKIVSPDVARLLLEGSDGLALGGSRRTLTLLFSDIRGFTSWSEGIEPEALVADLNRYFTEMVAIVHEEGGVVDKFIGDGMMAVFGLVDPDGAALRATRAARRMIEAVDLLSPTLTRPLRIGVGVHRGEVVAGNIGSPDRMEYTFIGDTMNTAARLESLTGKIGETILVSSAVVAQLPAEERARWESRGAHELKGKSAAFEVHAPARA
jgi:class 3 adenylate cyclase